MHLDEFVARLEDEHSVTVVGVRGTIGFSGAILLRYGREGQRTYILTGEKGRLATPTVVRICRALDIRPSDFGIQI